MGPATEMLVRNLLYMGPALGVELIKPLWNSSSPTDSAHWEWMSHASSPTPVPQKLVLHIVGVGLILRKDFSKI